MKNYVLQDACANCAHGFSITGYDDLPTFCCLGGGDRPKCGVDHMAGESWVDALDHEDRGKKFSAGLAAWEKWSIGRKVVPYGICDAYTRKRGKEQP